MPRIHAIWEWLSNPATYGALAPFVPFVVAVTAGFGLVAAALRVATAIIEFLVGRRARAMQKRISEGENAPSFTPEEIRHALRNYIEPDCAQSDPSNEPDLRRVADVRERVLSAVDRFVQHGGERRYMLLLADTGMGKTSFCLNYYYHVTRRMNWQCSIASLSRADALAHVRKLSDRRNTILLLDALDEDVEAIRDGSERVQVIMSAVADFRAVIITCRSQFFRDDAAVPTETGISVITPRKAGEAPGYKFYRLYLLPFTEAQVRRYIERNFPLWTREGFASRKGARRLLENIRELSVRPMLLALIPDLVRAKSTVTELYDLYTFMVDRWLERESKWMSQSTLLSTSLKLSVHLYVNSATTGGRITVKELREVAGSDVRSDQDFHFLTARSLLNRDSAGKYKFAHRSILEYMVVRAAIEGDARCFDVLWTDFMRRLFVSWGATASGRANVSRALEVLSADLRKTGLYPLIPNLPEPTGVSADEIRQVLAGRSKRGSSSERLPIEWRQNSLRQIDMVDYWLLYDLGYGLVWQVLKLSQMSSDDRIIYRHSFQEVSKIKRGMSTIRLPSLSELLSLIEAEQVIGRVLLERDENYWVGDQLGRARHLIVSFNGDLGRDERLTLVETGRPLDGRPPISVYEVAMRERPGVKGDVFRAQAVMVVRGNAEDAWHSDSGATLQPVITQVASDSDASQQCH